MMTTATHAAAVETAQPFNNTLGCEALLRRVFPPDEQEQQGGFVKLVALEAEGYFRWEAGTLRWPGDASRTVATFVTQCGGVDVRFSPILSTSPTLHAPVLPLRLVWATITLPVVPPQRGWPTVGVKAVDRLAALARFTGVRPAPSVILDEGDTVSGLWALSDGLDVADPRLERARRYLTAQVGGDLNIAVGDVRRVSVMLPGVRSSTIYPAHVCVAFPWSETRYPISAFEQ
jgi:hypothetical protein